MTSNPAASPLGDFLRARRARVQPTDVGLPAGLGRRRTAGLRREELASLAGISIDYYIRLEQGRETNPSAPVLSSLARALRLDDEGTHHLFALADHVAGRATRPRPELEVRPGLLLLLSTLRPCPAYVRNRTGDILAANPEGLALLWGIHTWEPERRNTARYIFLHPAARTLYADWPHHAAATVAHLRVAAAADPDDPALAALVTELTEFSDEFAALWQRYDVRSRRSDRKTFLHPTVGRVTFAYESLDTDRDGQRLAVYQTAPGTADHEAMLLLGLAADHVVGTGD